VTVRSADDLRAKIREVPDFPKPGILFYDITTLLKDAEAFRDVVDRMADQVKDAGIELVVGMESRGFIFSAPLAYKIGAGFVPVRKLGKLPAPRRSRSTATRSRLVSGCSSSTTCSPRAAR